MLALWEATGVAAQTGGWTTPVNVSNNPTASWFPDLAVDSLGNVHMVWCETTPLEGGGHKEQVYYSMWDDQTWSTPSDIVPPSPDIIRNAIAADQMGNLHMLFGGSVPSIGHLNMFYKRALVEEAWSAAQWSAPHRISQSDSYRGDIVIDSKGVIHVTYDERVGYESEADSEAFLPVVVSDIIYRHSTDGGQTWSYPVNLSSSSRTGSSRVQMEIDSSETIHITWDEGWELLGRGDPIYGSYTFSTDGGETWAPVASVSYPDSANAQLTVGSDGSGGVMLVWRTTSRDEIFYQWSSDGGNSWAPPAVIPGIFARPWWTEFDMYDMATDSGGHIHLVVVGRLSPEEDRLGVYHLEWDGASWSPPTAIYWGAGFPEYPKIIISEGNKLHVAWFVRDDPEEGNREVWYSSSQSASPAQTPVPPPTSTPTPTATPLATATPTATPYPTLAPVGTALPDGLYTESDELLRLLVGLAPVLILVTAILVIRFVWLRRSSGR